MYPDPDLAISPAPAPGVPTTIQSIFRDIGLPRLRRTKKRAPKQLTLFEKPRPGDSVQVDVEVVKVGGEKAYPYTALDDCTRYRVLRLYKRLHVRSSLLFFSELCRAFPFPIRQLQSDNGAEFPFAFSLTVQEAGIRYRYIRPRRPQQNGIGERFHKTIYTTLEALQADLDRWLAHYNTERPHQGRWCYGKTPMQTFLDSIPLAKEKRLAA